MELITNFVKNKVNRRLVESEKYKFAFDNGCIEWACSYSGLFNRFEFTPRGFIIRFTTVSDEYEKNFINNDKQIFESIVNIYAIEIYKIESIITGKIYLENTSDLLAQECFAFTPLSDIEFDGMTLFFRENLKCNAEVNRLPRSALMVKEGKLYMEYYGQCIGLTPRHIKYASEKNIRSAFKLKSK